jgi:hypothetical protein
METIPVPITTAPEAGGIAARPSVSSALTIGESGGTYHTIGSVRNSGCSGSATR